MKISSIVPITFLLVLAMSLSATGNDLPPKPAAALAAFERGDYVSALNMYLALREFVQGDEKHRAAWIERTAQVVRCYTATGNDETAIQEYFLLCQVAPPSQMPLDCIPLPWVVTTTKVGLRLHEKTAIDRLDSLKHKTPGPPATLLAAAVLSVNADSARRNQGISLLRNLEAQYVPDREAADLSTEPAKDPREQEIRTRQHVALLASAFLWRQRMPRLRLASELAPLKRTVRRLPEPLRAGPYLLLGLSAQRVGEHEAAVLALMRLPILFPHEKVFCTEALGGAALSLEKLGRADQAMKLRQEAGLAAPE